MNELIAKNLYEEIKNVLELARSRTYTAVNFAMVEAYWHIGCLIVEQQGGEERAGYGKNLLKYLAERLTEEYGRGFDESNLRYMRKFYMTFPNCDALRHELSWTHYAI